MTTPLSTGSAGWRRPDKCNCGKIPYRDEASALAAADRRREEFDTPFRAYKCPGTTRWHLATRGFHPRALKSRARIIAWHVSARRVISFDGLLGELGITDRYSGPVSRVRKTLRVFSELGLIALDDPRQNYITGVDFDGLARVMAVGLAEYASSRGINLRGPAK